MSDILSAIGQLRRPRLLIRAARAGQTDYNRNRDLGRLLQSPTAPSPDRALRVLMAEEERAEETRKTGDASYSLIRHVELLIAMMGELRLLPRVGEA